jgi:hypothetical protein
VLFDARFPFLRTGVTRRGFSWERGRFSGALFRGELARGVRGNLTREEL